MILNYSRARDITFRGKRMYALVLHFWYLFRFFVCRLCVRALDVLGSEEAFLCFCLFAVYDLPSVSCLLLLSAGLMPLNLEQVTQVHYRPAQTLSRCGRSPLKSTSLCFCRTGRILWTVFLHLQRDHLVYRLYCFASRWSLFRIYRLYASSYCERLLRVWKWPVALSIFCSSVFRFHLNNDSTPPRRYDIVPPARREFVICLVQLWYRFLCSGTITIWSGSHVRK